MSSKMSLMPNISIPRSRFKQNFNHSLDMFHGDVVPVDCFEVIPGDEFKYDLASLIRMSTPIVPIMGNIKACVHAFFVPLRLIWDDAEKFYGDPTNHDKISTVTAVDPASILIPYVSSSFARRISTSDANFVSFMYSVQDYLGKDDIKAIYDKNPDSTAFYNWLNSTKVSQLKERAYLTIWNDHFRPSLMVPPVLVNKSTSATSYGSASFLGATFQTLAYPFKPLKGFKQYDYFTANTYSPQYATSAVTLPLGDLAPVYFVQESTVAGAIGDPIELKTATTLAGDKSALGIPDGQGDVYGKLIADLSNATAASWNMVRYAAQLQKYFERSNYGNRYFEILNAHYGITNPDSRLQRAERLGSHEFYLNISQVVSTADTENGGTGQNLGNTGAVSSTGDNCHLFTKSFSEPGYVMVVITTKYDRIYSSGWLREDLKSNRFEFYSPEFANLGDQETKLLEIQSFSSAGLNTINDVFGFQEHWAEYRYRKNLVSGSMRVGKSMDIWTPADQFDDITGDPHAKLTLGYNFLVEDRSALARLLATGTSGPDYICDFHANIIATREMPLYSIPGLIDHFGAL